jgi:hypothetical protein
VFLESLFAKTSWTSNVWSDRLGKWWSMMEFQFVLPVDSEPVSLKASVPATVFLSKTKMLIKTISLELRLSVIVPNFMPTSAARKANYMFLVVIISFLFIQDLKICINSLDLIDYCVKYAANG